MRPARPRPGAQPRYGARRRPDHASGRGPEPARRAEPPARPAPPQDGREDPETREAHARFVDKRDDLADHVRKARDLGLPWDRNVDGIDDLTGLTAYIRRFEAVLTEHPATRSGRPVPGADLDDIDTYLRRLDAALSRVARSPAYLHLAPNVAGRAQIGRDIPPLALIEMRDSRGIAVGNDCTVVVEHVCHIERPTVEIAELMREDPDLYWLRSILLPNPGEGATPLRTRSVEIGSPFSASTPGARGVLVGDDGYSHNVVHHTVTGCGIDASALLANAAVRDAVRACRADGLDGSARRQAMTHLRTRVFRAVADTNARALFGDWQKHLPSEPVPRVRYDGGRIAVVHATGAALGRGNRVDADVDLRMCRVVVR
jgi:hypothetical protein